MKLPRWGYLAIAGSLVVAFLGRVVMQRMARPHPWFAYSAQPLDQAGYAALAARPGWTKSSLRVAEGVSLCGLIRRPTQQGAPWLLFYPGNDRTQLANAQVLLERTRGENDWGLAVYATRGYDCSDGTPAPSTWVSDGVRIFEALLESEHLEPRQVHLLAFSLGGYAAAHVASQAVSKNRKPASLTLFASVARIAMVHGDWLSRFTLGDVYDVLPTLSAVPGPVLVLQGSADQAFGGNEQGLAIAAGLGERARYLELPGVGHEAILQSEAAISAARALVEAHAVR